MKKIIFIILVALFVLASAGLIIFINKAPSEPGGPVVLSPVEKETTGPTEKKATSPAEEPIVEEEMPRPSAEELVDWKTYTTEKFGFEIKYPSDWTTGFSSGDLREAISFNSPPAVISTIEGREISAPQIVITIIAMKNVQNLGLVQAAESEQKRPEEEGYQLLSQKDILFKGISAKKLTFSDGEKYAIHYVLLKDGNIYRFISEMTKEDEKLKEISGKIIYTFKFTPSEIRDF